LWHGKYISADINAVSINLTFSKEQKRRSIKAKGHHLEHSL